MLLVVEIVKASKKQLLNSSCILTRTKLFYNKQTILMRLFSFMLSVAASALVVSSCNNVDFKKTKGGMPYKLYASKEGKKAVQGGFLKVHMIIKKNDSVLQSTYTSMPTYLPVSAESQPYDVSELIPQLKKGDSVYAVQSVDTFMRRTPDRIPPFFKKGDKLTTSIRVLEVFATPQETQTDYEKEQLASSKGQLLIDDKIIQEHLAKNNIKAQKIGQGTYVEIVTPGTGAPVVDGKYVSLMYKGTTFAGKVFDTNMDNTFKHTEPMSFVVGGQPMIKGFEEGIKQLKEGAKAKLYIPSSLAYGAQAPSPDIAPNTNMIFDIEVVKVEDKAPPSANMPPSPQGDPRSGQEQPANR
jgi:FKBP-type peptidyl-prolyl cis-trans isomerase